MAVEDDGGDLESREDVLHCEDISGDGGKVEVEDVVGLRSRSSSSLVSLSSDDVGEASGDHPPFRR